MAAAFCYDHLLKLVVVGDRGVGKTALIRQLLDGSTHVIPLARTGFTFVNCNLEQNGQIYRLQIGDLKDESHNHISVLMQRFYLGAGGAVVVYDVASKASFQNVTRWHTEITSYAPDNVHIILVGNKCDLEKATSTEEAQSLAKELGMAFLETTANAPQSEDVLGVFGLLADRIRPMPRVVVTLHGGSVSTNEQTAGDGENPQPVDLSFTTMSGERVALPPLDPQFASVKSIWDAIMGHLGKQKTGITLVLSNGQLIKSDRDLAVHLGLPEL